MKIIIDSRSGYCFGVNNAIGQAEAILEEDGTLYSLGQIVHNDEEVNRLGSRGLIVINHEEFSNLRNCRVLIRAHGEPPSTYETALRNNILLIDATCPIVRHLQSNIRDRALLDEESKTQVVIYGKERHPEVIGLAGHAGGVPLIIHDINDIQHIDPEKDVHLYAQTTMDPDGFNEIARQIGKYLSVARPENPEKLFVHNTICRQVSGRVSHLKKFAATHELILFVSGKDSSNGQFLFGVCREINPRSYLVSQPEEIRKEWLDNISTIGISGATSTPVWQMNAVRDYILSMVSDTIQ